MRKHPLPDELEAFLQMGITMRKTPWLVPRGVYRFKTFEEAQEWMERETVKTLRLNSHDPQR